MYRLNLTKKLAAEGFDAAKLAALEFESLTAAARCLSNEGAVITADALTDRANAMLPPDNDPGEGYRLFFSTSNEVEARSVDALTSYGDYLSKRAEAFEYLAQKALDRSTSMPEWIRHLDLLAHQYSYILEAASSLEQRGLVPMRRATALETLVTRPSDDNVALAALFDKATAIQQHRADTVKPHLQQSFA